MSALVQQTTVGISVVDTEGHFTFTNERYCQIVGRSREELLKINVNEITHAEDLPASLTLFRRAISSGENFEMRKGICFRTATPFGYTIVKAFLATPSAKRAVLMAVTIDITKRRLFK
jgi:PAS domain S-box-containing protein